MAAADVKPAMDCGFERADGLECALSLLIASDQQRRLGAAEADVDAIGRAVLCWRTYLCEHLVDVRDRGPGEISPVDRHCNQRRRRFFFAVDGHPFSVASGVPERSCQATVICGYSASASLAASSPATMSAVNASWPAQHRRHLGRGEVIEAVDAGVA